MVEGNKRDLVTYNNIQRFFSVDDPLERVLLAISVLKSLRSELKVAVDADEHIEWLGRVFLDPFSVDLRGVELKVVLLVTDCFDVLDLGGVGVSFDEF